MQAVTGNAALSDADLYRMEYLARFVIEYAESKKSDWVTYANNEPYWARQIFEAAEMVKEELTK